MSFNYGNIKVALVHDWLISCGGGELEGELSASNLTVTGWKPRF